MNIHIGGTDCMKKIVIIPDSFKGTMSSIEVCDIIKKGIIDIKPDMKIVKIPVADGGRRNG